MPTSAATSRPASLEGSKRRQASYPAHLPLGYVQSSVTGRIEIDIFKAPYIIEAFEKTAEDEPLEGTLAHVQRLGLTDADEKPLTASSLRRLLKNPFYAGIVRRGGRLCSGSHQPLVSKTLFERAQRSLRKRRY
jgi:site-specific DNA recombinase